MKRRTIIGFVVVVALSLWAVPRAIALRRAETVLVRLQERMTATASGSGARDVGFTKEEIAIQQDAGAIRARLYRSIHHAGRTQAIVLAHGVHFQGIEERRLVAFAGALAEAGMFVLTPELDDLKDYRITLRSERQIAETVRYLSSRTDLPIRPEIGVLGISFAGGLSLLAAAEPDVGAKLAWVTSMGGHHDLPRVLRFFARNQIETAHGMVERRANEYGLVVLVYGNLDRFVPEADRALATDAMRAWLHEDRDKARTVAARFSTTEAKQLMTRLEGQRFEDFRPEVEKLLVEKASELATLSPHGRLGQIRCPVFLLHGEGDSVIPAAETQWADLELGSQPHTTLITPVIEHAEVDRPPSLGERIMLVRFMAALL